MIVDEYLEILAGHVFDNDKLVTYKWLSKELQVHVNVAKQILWEFYEKHRENGDIQCTYLLIGVLNDNGMRVEVVKESDLSRAKEKFSQIISEHVYSVHKPLEDLELLASSGMSGDVKYSAVKCDACVERSDEEMHLMRWGATSKRITEEKPVNSKPAEPANHLKTDKKPAAAKKNGFNNFFNTAGKQKSPETSKTHKTDRDEESEKNNGLSEDADSMERDKGSEKNKGPLEKSKGTAQSSRSKKVSPKTEEAKKKKGGLENFFGKVSSLPKAAEVKAPEKKVDPVKRPEKEEDPVKRPEKEEDPVKKEVSESKKVKEKEKPRGKKRVRSQGGDNSAKKRKRIVILSDSSDSEAQSDADMDTEEPMAEAVAAADTEEEPARSKSPSPPAVKHENGKRRVLKMVNETYKDDRGFIVTKKVHVYVSCSEDEEEERERKKREEEQERKKREKAPPAKKAQAKANNDKKKQTTLTNFFKAS